MKQPQIVLVDVDEKKRPIRCNISHNFYDTFFKEYEEQKSCVELDTENAKRYFKK